MKYNNTPRLLIGLAAAAASAVVARADLQLGFSGLTRAGIQFNTASDSFQFLNSGKSGSQWYVNKETGGAGSAVGLLGSFGTGAWNIGSLTTVNGVQSASVSTTSGFQLSGLIGTVGAATLTTSGNVASLIINLTGLTYGGNNADLLALSKSGQATVDLSFVLGANGLGVRASDFTVNAVSGTIISPVPEVTTALAGAGAVGLLFLGTGMIRRKTVSREGGNNQ